MDTKSFLVAHPFDRLILLASSILAPFLLVVAWALLVVCIVKKEKSSVSLVLIGIFLTLLSLVYYNASMDHVEFVFLYYFG